MLTAMPLVEGITGDYYKIVDNGKPIGVVVLSPNPDGGYYFSCYGLTLSKPMPLSISWLTAVSKLRPGAITE